MLISFELENWMSFRDRVTFSMVASRERQHRERVAKLDRYGVSVLPVAAIYGGNASGKTNFFKALNFAKQFIVKGSQPDSNIPVEPYRLDDEYILKPSRFKFEILANDTIYEYLFAVNRYQVTEERLVQISGTSEKILFDRFKEEFPVENAVMEDRLEIVYQGTRDNVLFLTNTISQKIETYLPIYRWFRDSLELIAPDTRFGGYEHFLDDLHPLYAVMNEAIPQLDMGLSQLGGEELPFDNLNIPEAIKMRLNEDVKEGETVRVMSNTANERFVVTRKRGELVAKKLVTFHIKEDGTKIRFDMRQESDGSQRVIDLLPAFLALLNTKSEKVFIIDEVDRSLHTMLVRTFIETYLNNCSDNSRTQLLFTTHDVLLMDQNLLRRDEMWVAERDSRGASKLISLSDYKDIRYDKDIRKSYLQGRLGGIPKVLLGDLSPSKPEIGEHESNV